MYICKPSTWEVRPDYEGFKAILSYNKFDWDLGYFRRKKRKSTPTPTHPYTHTHKYRCGASGQFPVLLLRSQIRFLRLNLHGSGAYLLGWLAREPQKPTCSTSQHLDYKHTQPAHLFIVGSRIELRPSLMLTYQELYHHFLTPRVQHSEQQEPALPTHKQRVP